jgi:general secretion pathway protein D
MKKWIAGLVLGLSVSCAFAEVFAPPVAFNFQSVSIVAMLQATYKNLLNRDYVISPEVLLLDKRISLSVKAVPVADLPEFVDSILRAQGVVSVKRGSIYYVDIEKAVAVPSGGLLAASDNGGSVKDSTAGLPDPVMPQALAPESHKVFKPMNRPVDFMVTVLNTAFAGPVARAAGSQLVLAAVGDERMASVLELAEALDVAPHAVEVSASFVEVSRTGSNSRGLSLVASVLGARFGASVGSGARGGLSISGGSFELVLDALAADGRFKQVSNSRVVGDESERMSLTVGDETPTLQSTGRDNQGNGTTSIVYRTSGVILDVTPKVLGSGRVALTVDGQISAFQATVTGVTGSPTLVKRQVKTGVTVGDSEVLIIGGLDDTKTTENRTGFSFLPKSWAARDGSDLKSDLVLILSAKVLAQK